MKKSAKRSSSSSSSEKETKVAREPLPWKQRLIPYGVALAGAFIAILGFAGLDLWPFAFFAFVGFFAAIELIKEPTGKKVFLLSLFFGFVANYGGYYWLVGMLKSFSGFNVLLCVLFASILILYTGGSFALIGWLWWRARMRGYGVTLAAVAAFLACEFVYPLLFPFYYGASFHMLPALMQIADLGGPLLVTALVVVVSAAVYEVGRAAIERKPIPRIAPIAAVAYVGLTLVYGAVRIGQVDARAREAPKLRVGLVQANMGIFAKREDPEEGQRRHIEQTLELEREIAPDLVVWPESAYAWFIPERERNVRAWVLGPVHTPTLFGGLASRRVEGKRRHFNTAYITDAEGNIRGTYDKTYLLAFGEYLPFGETFPILYQWSPNSGHFTPGNHVRPVPFRNYRIATLICYEDILPRFVRSFVSEGDPHLFVNMTNDAWFGDTTEPWIHLALAKFRAVEHHRFLVRSTNSGVSAVIDPVGRVVTHSGAFTRENLHATVAMLTGRSIYSYLGDWPGWLSLGAIVFMAFVRPRRKTGTRAGVPSV